MAKEIRTKKDMLVWRLGQMAEENAELELRLNRLLDEYNCTADALSELRKREKEASEKEKPDEKREGSGENRETSTKTMLGEMFQMRDHCDMLENENRKLKDFEKAIYSFMKDKKIYMEKGTLCGYIQGSPAVCSSACLECDSCLGVIDECGVICRQTLYGVKVKSAIR